METTKAGAWRQSTTELHTFGSGRVALLQRPGPEIHLEFGQLPQHLLAAWQSASKQKDLEESGLAFLAKMSTNDRAKFMLFAAAVVKAVFKKPYIVADRDPQGDDEVTPDDITDEFWEAFMWGCASLPGAKVKTRQGETTVEAVETFRAKPAVSGVVASGENVRRSSKRVGGHP